MSTCAFCQNTGIAMDPCVFDDIPCPNCDKDGLNFERNKQRRREISLFFEGTKNNSTDSKTGDICIPSRAFISAK